MFLRHKESHTKIRGRQVGDGMGGGRNGSFWGAPILHIFEENAVFSRVLAQNRAAPKTAVPTTTHPIPHFTTSESMNSRYWYEDVVY